MSSCAAGVKTNLLDSADQLLRLGTRIVIFDACPARSEIDVGGLDALDFRKLPLDAADASTAGHSIYFEFYFGHNPF
jgi:hypothetical protein